MYEVLLKILKFFTESKTPSFQKKSKISQACYLNNFDKKIYENSLIKRSYYQWKCQRFLQFNYLYLFLINIISMPIIIAFIIYVIIIKINPKHTEKTKKTNRKIAINIGYSNCIPNTIKKEFNILNGKKGFNFDLADFKFFIKNVYLKYPLSFYFNLKILIKISLYSYIIKNYNLNAILVNSEYTFTSSILTLYCRLNNVEHINVMHGEKLFNIRDSFCEFDRFYIWDEYYKDLLTKLNMPDKQFIVNNIKTKKYETNKMYNNLNIKYYLQLETEKELEKISSKLKELKVLGYNVLVRPHPRYSDLKKIESIFNGIKIEKLDISIEESIDSTNYVVSKFSTVLYEAYLKNKNIVIDDVSNEKLYEDLKSYEYIMFSKKHILLSDIANCNLHKLY